MGYVWYCATSYICRQRATKYKQHRNVMNTAWRRQASRDMHPRFNRINFPHSRCNIMWYRLNSSATKPPMHCRGKEISPTEFERATAIIRYDSAVDYPHAIAFRVPATDKPCSVVVEDRVIRFRKSRNTRANNRSKRRKLPVA